MKKTRFFNLINQVLFLCIFFSLISYCIFLRGLESDGVESLSMVIFKNTFFYETKARIFFHFLYELPFVLFLKIFPYSSLNLIKMIWSFSLIWVHLYSFLICYIILPKGKKNLIFFPLMSFVFGPMTALGLSVSVSFIVCSYIWTAAFVIYYSDLSIRWHKFIFILSIGTLFLSHEMISYMAFPLIFLCFIKLKINQSNKFLIYIGIFLLLSNSLLSGIFVFFPDWPVHRTYFLKSFSHLYFFYKKGFYTPTVSAFLLLIGFFIQFYFPLRRLVWVILVPFFVFFCVMSFITPIHPIFNNFISFWSEYDKRVWVVISLPFTLWIWWLFEMKKFHFSDFKLFFILLLMLAISLTGWRIGTDYRFYQYQTQFVERLANCHGYVSWSEIEEASAPFKPWFLKYFYNIMEDPQEHIINASIFYSDFFEITSIIRSDMRPLWLCPDTSFLNKNLFEFNNKRTVNDFSEFIQKNCKTANIKQIYIEKFDFSEFIQFVKSNKSFCKKHTK